MELPAGRVKRLLHVQAPDGSWHLAATVAAEGEREVVGFLVGPANGSAGQLGFEPVEGFELEPAPAAVDPTDPERVEGVEPPKPAVAGQGGGPLTTGDVPLRKD